jgi:hypothetical protein
MTGQLLVVTTTLAVTVCPFFAHSTAVLVVYSDTRVQSTKGPKSEGIVACVI